MLTSTFTTIAQDEEWQVEGIDGDKKKGGLQKITNQNYKRNIMDLKEIFGFFKLTNIPSWVLLMKYVTVQLCSISVNNLHYILIISDFNWLQKKCAYSWLSFVWQRIEILIAAYCWLQCDDKKR